MNRSILLLISTLLTSCASVYFPNTRNAPMFSGKGELQGSVTAAFGTNVQAAYALSDHVGVTVNLMSASKDIGYYGEHNYREGGIGYYKNLKTEMKRSSLYVDVFAGYGTGDGNVTIDGGSKSLSFSKFIQGSYQKLFLQPGFAFKFDQWGAFHLHLGAVYRLSFIDFSNLSGEMWPYPNRYPATPITFTKTQFFFHEPAVIGKAIFKQFYLTWQAGLNFSFEETGDVAYNPLQCSVGVGVRLDLKNKKK